jgi:tape measure domain-containing protein
MGISSKEIQYTLKVKNDPSNTAAIASTAAALKTIQPGVLAGSQANAKALLDQAARLKATAEMTRLATAEAKLRAAQLQAETIQIKQQILVENQLAKAKREAALAAKAQAVASAKAATGMGTAGFLGGLAAGSKSGKSGIGETARINSEGNLRLNIFSRLNSMVDIAIAAIIGNKILDLADDFARLTGKIKVNTETEGQAATVRERLISLSERTHTDLEQNVDAWEKLVQVGRTYHKSQNDILGVQETLIKGLRIGGASTGAASASMAQFVAVINRGRASAMGFNQIFKQSPEFMNMLANAMGKPLNAFTTLNKKSRVTMDEIIAGIQKVSKEVDDKFEKLPTTMREGFQDTKTAFEVMIGVIGERLKLSPELGEAFERLAKTLRNPDVINAVSRLVNFLGTAFVHAVNGALAVMDYFSRHTDQLAAIMDVASVVIMSRFVAAIVHMAEKATSGYSALGLLGKGVGSLTHAMTGLSLVSTATKDAALAAGAAEAGAGQGMVTAGEIASKIGPALINPWVAIPVAIGAVIAGLYIFGDEIDASGRHAYTAKDVIVGAFIGARDGIVSAWSSFAPTMADYFDKAADAAIPAANRMLTAFNSVNDQLGSIFGAMGLHTLPDMIHRNLPSWATTDIRDVLGAGVEQAGQAGHAYRNMYDQQDKSWFNKIRTQLDMDKMNKPLTGGAPVGKDQGKTKKDHKAADAMRALQDYIDEVTRAITEQEKMNKAILEGPAAVRAVSVEMARSKVILSETQKLEKAGINLKKNAFAASQVKLAGDQAARLELQKQIGEHNKLTRSIVDQTTALNDARDATLRGIQGYTADERVRRVQGITLARLNAEQEKYNELKKEEWEITDKDRAAIKAYGAAAARAEATRYNVEAVKKYYELIDSARTPQQAAIDDWQAIGFQIDVAVDQLKQVGKWTQKGEDDARRYWQAIKPPENIVEAFKSGIGGFLRDFEMTNAKVAEGIKNVANDVANSFVEMAASGKFSFKALARSVIQDLLRMITQALMFKAIMAGLNLISPGLGNILMGAAPRGHSGGIAGMAASGNMGAVNPMMFAAAKRYHTGGLVGLKSGEVPIIAKRGEAVLPTVRLPDGSFGVRSAGGSGGATVFAPNISIKIDANGKKGGGDGLNEEQSAKLAKLVDDEINIHLQRKLEEWMRPGGPLYGQRARR